MLLAQCAPVQAESVVKLPAAAVDPAVGASRATAILAGGCFWGVEGVFSHVKGVIAVEAGYHGGSKATARYDETGSGTTGHAESVRITYRSEEHTSELQSLMRISYAVFCLKNK